MCQDHWVVQCLTVAKAQLVCREIQSTLEQGLTVRNPQRVSLCHPGCPGTQKSACLCFLSAGIKGLVLFKDFPFASQLVWPSWSDVICLRILTYLVQIINLWSHWDILLCFGSSGGTCEASVLFSFWDRVSLICPG